MNQSALRSLFLFLLFLSISSHASANEYSLSEAEQRFLACNLQLVAERYTVDKAEAQILQAKLFDNPSLSFEQNVYNRINKKYFDFGPEGETAVSIEQLIYIAGQRNNRIHLERVNKEMALYQFEEVLRTLRSELRSTFIELYYTQKNARVYEYEIGSLQRILEGLEQQHQKGNISLFEKTRIQALLLSLQQEHNSLDNQITALEGKIKLMLALKQNDPLQIQFNDSLLTQITLDRIPYAELQNTLPERPDLKLADTGIRLSQQDIKLQKSLAFPEVRLTGSYDKAGNFINNYFSIGMNLTLPVFNRNQGNLKAARIQEKQNSSLRDLNLQQAEQELYTGYSRLSKALDLYHSTSSDLESNFEKLITGVNENYRKRTINLLEFIDYYQTYKETCLQFHEIKKNVFLATEELNTICSRNLFNY